MTGMTNDAALVVRVDRACKMLDCSRDKLYRLMRAGKIKSFRDEGSRKIELASLRAYIARGIAADRLAKRR